MLAPVPVVNSLTELEIAARLGVDQVIICYRNFSRTGILSLSQGLELAQQARQRGVRPLLQWDLLMTESVLQHTQEQIKQVLGLGVFHALRVQDVGALQWALEETSHPLHWIAETGNHNLRGLQEWAKIIGERLERLVLSLEISQEGLREVANKLSIPLELLGLGPILLFYTPRHLLQNFADDASEQVKVLATSEESAHKNFPVVQNCHGTFLYHQKHHWLLQHGKELAAMGMTHLRLEVESESLLEQALQLWSHPDPQLLEQFQANYPVPLIRGFYHRNKSQVLFSKLKNEILENLREEALGEVVGVEKGNYLGVQLREGAVLQVGGHYRMQTPEGKNIAFTLRNLKDFGLHPADQLRGGVVLVDYVKGACPKSLITQK